MDVDGLDWAAMEAMGRRSWQPLLLRRIQIHYLLYLLTRFNAEGGCKGDERAEEASRIIAACRSSEQRAIVAVKAEVEKIERRRRN